MRADFHHEDRESVYKDLFLILKVPSILICLNPLSDALMNSNVFLVRTNVDV